MVVEQVLEFVFDFISLFGEVYEFGDCVVL